MALRPWLCALAFLTVSLAADKFDLSVDSIMRGPQLTGHAPRKVRWSGNSQRIYFEWKQATDPVLKDFDTYVVQRNGTGLRKLSFDEARLTPPDAGHTSNDGRHTVYAIEGDLYVYEHATDKARRLFQTTDRETSPRFLRDNKRISFTRGNNLFVMNLDGSGTIQLTDIRTGPDPEKKLTPSQEYLKNEEQALLAIVRDREQKKKEEEARQPRKPFYLSARQSIASLQLSPDEAYVIGGITEKAESSKSSIVPAYVSQSAYTETISARTNVGDRANRHRVALIDVKTGALRYIETGVGKPEEIVEFVPVFSEDGTRAVLEAAHINNKDRWILALDLKTAKAKTLVTMHDDAWIQTPQPISIGWMKNDRDVYFVQERDGYAHLYTVSHESGEPKQLTSGEWEIWDLALSLDKERFYLTTNEGGPAEQHLYVMNAEGGERKRLTSQPGMHEAKVSPDQRRIADLYSYVTKPTELLVQDAKLDAKPAKITDSPLPEFWQYAWKDAPIVSILSRDGTQVPGRLFASSKRGGPAVIFVHGAGYLQNIHKGWSNYYREYMFHHLLAERGYTVLDIDYRGSAGYGRDWRTAIYRHMGGKDLDDHIDAAKWLVSEHGVDAKRIGIYGGSYGGFITLMAMFKHPDVFAAGAALRPVTDWAHYNHGYTSNILNIPQDDAEAYKRSSPIYFAEGLKGALLICHGLVDINVHAQDSIRLTQSLIELRKERWELALYPVEDHAFVQPTSWADEYRRILKLFEDNLR